MTEETLFMQRYNDYLQVLRGLKSEEILGMVQKCIVNIIYYVI